MTDQRHFQVLTTIDTRPAADALSRAAVQARAAACGQVVGPIQSTYWWGDKIETTEEWYVVFKTSAERYPALESLLREKHGYDVPEIVATPIVAGNPDYLSWVTAETTDR